MDGQGVEWLGVGGRALDLPLALWQLVILLALSQQMGWSGGSGMF